MNKLKNKYHVIFSIEAGNAFDKIQHLFMIKNSPESWHGRNIPNTIKTMYEKSTANITFNGEKLKAFPLRSGTKQEIHAHHLYSTMSWKS